MKTAGASLTVLLLAVVFVSLQVSASEDLYWEGEEDSSNEYLEVKDKDIFSSGLHRIKRQFDFFNIFSSSSTSTTTTEEPSQKVDDEPEDNDNDEGGSGAPWKGPATEPKEKTVRVSFVVVLPYLTAYSNRDSEEFRNLSKSLATAVNALYDGLPGTQRAALVRIQSRLQDTFSCKVTLDIVTTGYDDIDHITNLLQDHIRNKRSFNVGEEYIPVSDNDFSTKIIDPGETWLTCGQYELQCDDGVCVSGTRCDGITDCNDGSDELNCPNDRGNTEPPTTPAPPLPTEQYAWSDNRGDQGGLGGDSGEEAFTDDSFGYETTPISQLFDDTSCMASEMQCDITRCVSLDKRCNGYNDCDDGADELGCNLGCLVYLVDRRSCASEGTGRGWCFRTGEHRHCATFRS